MVTNHTHAWHRIETLEGTLSVSPAALLPPASHRFRGLAIGGGSTDEAAKARLLESLQIPKEFYLPEAAAVAVPKRCKGVDQRVAGVKGAAVAVEQQQEDDPDDDDGDGGFLSFGAAGDMEVDL